MKMRLFGLVALAMAGAFLMSGCGCFMQASKGETAPPQPPKAQVAPPEQKQTVAVKETPVQPQQSVVLKDVNFDFDKYAIRSVDGDILKKDAEWFKANGAGKMKIEGHCDERGTTEYNLALGQKRADAAKNYLVSLGIDGKKIATVSYGKEKPLDPGHNEAAWAKNRRAHLVPVK
jgi:peptidoglycan-associated lipoprotein